MSSPNQPAARPCEDCGAPLRQGASGGLCLRCALGNALAPPDAHDAIASARAGEENQSMAGDDPSRRHFGDYELLEELGRGGMGVVYKARQKSLGRTVAVKMILAGEFANKEFVTRFRAEASAAAVLQHPNIVAIHEVGVQDGQHYFSMDYVPGRTLAEVAREGPLPARRAAGYLKTIAEAIHYAHEHGILHRDLKPANVLIDEHDQPRITDFGLAKRLTDSQLSTLKPQLTLTGQMLGSPNYMAPEQATGRQHQVSRRTDVYALGAMLYHVLTGHPPFVSESIGETLQQVLNTEPVPPRLLNAGVPRDLETICLKCLEKEPTKRFPTAQALADELGRFLNREPIQARPVTALERSWRWCRRKPVIATLSATTLLLLLAVVIGSPIALFHISKHRQNAEKNAGDLRLSLYAAQMSQAFRAWDVGNLNVARALLNAQRPRTGETDLRGADWRWLWSLCQIEAKAVLPTRGEWMILTAEPSPDGRWLATAGWSHDVVLHDLAGKEQPKIFRGHTRNLMGGPSVAFSPDGRRLASTSGGLLVEPGPCELFLWDLATTNRTVLEGHDVSVLAVAFSPDGTLLASACLDGSVGMWDAKTGRNLAILRGHKKSASALAFSGNGEWLFSAGDDGIVRRWDVAARRESGPPLQHELPVSFLAVAPDARMIATACTDNYLRLWDVTSSHVRKLRYSPAERVRALAFSPDGRLLAFGTGNNIRLWDLQAEQEKTALRGSAGVIASLRFLSDGRQLVSASEFDRPMLWDIDRPEKLITLQGFREGIRSMTVSADQRWLVVGSGDFFEPQRPAEVIVFDLATRQALLPALEHPEGVNSVSLGADGRLLATGCVDESVRIFTLPHGRLIRTLTNAVAHRIGNLLFSPDGLSLVACGGSPSRLAVWNTATWQPRTLLPDPPADHKNFAFSADGSLLVTPMGGANFAIVWNMPSATTNTVLRFDGTVGPAAFSLDGTMLALQRGHFDIELFKVQTWERLGALIGHQHVINQIAFAPDGKTLASVAIDGSVRLWSVPGCEEVAALYDHRDSTETVAFTPDGQWLISGSRDKTVKLRRIPSFDEISAAENAEAARR